MKPNKRKQMLDRLKSLSQVLDFFLPLVLLFIMLCIVPDIYGLFKIPMCFENKLSSKQTL